MIETAATITTRHVATDGDHQHCELLLRETNHRCSNDLQLVVSLLALQSRRASNPEVGQALADAMERVHILARARSSLNRYDSHNLEDALREVCEALHAQGEHRSICFSFQSNGGADTLAPKLVTTLALVVNELATNAIKHAFVEGKGGRIQITLPNDESGVVTVLVDDDGLPFPDLSQVSGQGLGIGLAKRLMTSVGGLLAVPSPGSKLFKLQAPRA